MRVIDEQHLATARGGILYDASRIVKPEDALFEREHWASKRALEEVRGGRGSIAVLHAGAEHWVLRRYRRGGWIAKVLTDQYLWTGAARTRSFVEWRLLCALHQAGLPVPAPIAARYVRCGATYRADLITEQLRDVQTFADWVRRGLSSRSVWSNVGATIAAFHRKGVHHADLNAHNILLGDEEPPTRIYVLDFDRGRIRARGAWENRVLSRLRRSLEKITAQAPGAFSQQQWDWLMAGYLEA